MEKVLTQKITLSLPSTLIEQLRARAALKKTSVSKLIVECITSGIPLPPLPPGALAATRITNLNEALLAMSPDPDFFLKRTSISPVSFFRRAAVVLANNPMTWAAIHAAPDTDTPADAAWSAAWEARRAEKTGRRRATRQMHAAAEWYNTAAGELEEELSNIKKKSEEEEED